MKFYLRVCGLFYVKDAPYTETLKSLGFEFKERGPLRIWNGEAQLIIRGDVQPEIEIKTIDDLMSLMEILDHDLILCDGNVIEIYDDYRE